MSLTVGKDTVRKGYSKERTKMKSKSQIDDTKKPGKSRQDILTEMTAAVSDLSKTMAQVKKQVQSIEERSTVYDTGNVEEYTDWEGAWDIRTEGPKGLIQGNHVNAKNIEYTARFAQKVGLVYNKQLGMRDFIFKCEAWFSYWQINPLEYMKTLLCLIPPEMSQILIKKPTTNISNFYRNLLIVASVFGDKKTVTELKQLFYNFSPETETDFLSLLLKLDSFATAAFEDISKVEIEVTRKLLNIVPQKFRERIKDALSIKNKGCLPSGLKGLSTLELCAAVGDSINEINCWLKRQKVQLAHSFQKEKVNPKCMFCCDVGHFAQNCTKRKDIRKCVQKQNEKIAQLNQNSNTFANIKFCSAQNEPKHKNGMCNEKLPETKNTPNLPVKRVKGYTEGFKKPKVRTPSVNEQDFSVERIFETLRYMGKCMDIDKMFNHKTKIK